MTSILKIEDLNIEAKQRNLSLKTLVFSALVFQKHSNFLFPDVLFLCCAEDIPLKFGITYPTMNLNSNLELMDLSCGMKILRYLN